MNCLRTFTMFFRGAKHIIIPPKYTTTSMTTLIKPMLLERQKNYFSHAVQDESDIIVDQICKGDEELEKKLRVSMLEVEVMRQNGENAPSVLQVKHWQQLMSLPSRKQRNKYLLYLFKTEKAKENDKAKKEAKRQEYERTKDLETKQYPDDLEYGINQQSLFLRIRESSMNRFDNYRVLRSALHGKPVVIDCSYEQHMVRREIQNAAKQVMLLFGDNRIHKEPFDIHMCNVNRNGDFMKNLKSNIPTLDEPSFPMNIHTNSYLDVFPKEKLVYLTPHCRNELTHYDDDAIYIIGCMVDKVNNSPFSLAKAKRDGIKMAKLPLDRYIEWAPGSPKNLNINHMVPIMLDLKLTGDWEYALKHIPRRKLMQTKILAVQKKISKYPELKSEVLKSYQSVAAFKNLHKDREKSRKTLFLEHDNM